MKQNFITFAVALLGSCYGTAVTVAQTLPSRVEPGVQRDRLLDRDSPALIRRPAVLQKVNCGVEAFDQGQSFVLRGVRLELEISDGESFDPTNYWAPYLNQEVTLEKVCEFARALADDYARKTGRSQSAVLPVQYIDDGIVHIAIIAN